MYGFPFPCNLMWIRASCWCHESSSMKMFMPSSKVSDLAPDISSTAIRCWHWNWCVPFTWVLELVFYSLIFVSEHNLFKHCGYKLLTAKWIAFFLLHNSCSSTDLLDGCACGYCRLARFFSWYKFFVIQSNLGYSNGRLCVQSYIQTASVGYGIQRLICNMQHVCFQKFMYTLCSSVSKLEVCKHVVFVIVLEVTTWCFLLHECVKKRTRQ